MKNLSPQCCDKLIAWMHTYQMVQSTRDKTRQIFERQLKRIDDEIKNKYNIEVDLKQLKKEEEGESK